jgi:hypothetical protein
LLLEADDSDRRSGHAGGAMAKAFWTALVAAALIAAGCGSPPDRNAPEGTTVVQDGVWYDVQTSRVLDPDAPDDRVFLGGRGAERLDRPGVTLLGVFLQARNHASSPRRSVDAPQLVDAFGEAYAPMRLPVDDVFAYRGARLPPGEQIPALQSPPAESPEEGLVLVYRVPVGVFVTDRPFTVRFGSSDRAASVQLDI